MDNQTQKTLEETAAYYGVQYTGTMVDGSYHDTVENDHDWSLKEVAAAGGKITRLRLLTERRAGRKYADVSYIHATLADGRIVRVNPTFNCMGMDWFKIKGILIEWAKAEGVFAKSLGLLDEGNWAVLNG